MAINVFISFKFPGKAAMQQLEEDEDDEEDGEDYEEEYDHNRTNDGNSYQSLLPP